MKYALVNLYSKEFEKLVVGICQLILGITAQHFSDGRDGGRDSRFEGEAKELLKKGKFIIQAKHTTNPIGKFTDADFSENKTSTIREELPKIKKLIDEKELDYYLLFSNRRMSADGEKKVRSLIMSTGLDSSAIFLFGSEWIESFLDQHQDLPQRYNVDLYFCPINIIPDDLADVICSFKENKLSNIVLPSETETDFYRPDIEEKNKINGLSKEYFDFMQSNSLSKFSDIEKFLESPINEVYKKYYDISVSDLEAAIIINKKEYDFDSILEKLYEHLIQQDGDLKKHRQLTRVFLHYMYWNCDIGKKR